MSDSRTARMTADAIEASGKSQREIATEMSYERPNVVSMIKNGDMRMPLERITEADVTDTANVAARLL